MCVIVLTDFRTHGFGQDLGENGAGAANKNVKIDSYSFGYIVINGKAYSSDVIIYGDRVDAAWWRKEGHRLHPDDIVDVLNALPDILIIGTGYAGVMSVPEKTIEHITSRGIDVRVERTGRAVDTFNALQEKKKHVIAALHLTC